jgi:Tfp pilus assembly protein PilV
MKMFLKSSAIKTDAGKAHPNSGDSDAAGFGLVETLMAVLLLALGFMFVGPMMVNSLESTTLARSKSTASLAATQILEDLARKYRANTADADLAIGSHGPTQVVIANPINQNALNRYSVGWTVSAVSDPRAGKQLRAVQVTATATPIASNRAATNNKLGQNKIINVTTILSFRN